GGAAPGAWAPPEPEPATPPPLAVGDDASGASAAPGAPRAQARQPLPGEAGGGGTEGEGGPVEGAGAAAAAGEPPGEPGVALAESGSLLESHPLARGPRPAGSQRSLAHVPMSFSSFWTIAVPSPSSLCFPAEASRRRKPIRFDAAEPMKNKRSQSLRLLSYFLSLACPSSRCTVNSFLLRLG
ncbi:unnamed protein product, partial [Prorocentrum cordatum]